MHQRKDGQEQHMYRIKSIAGVLEGFGMAALPAVIQPDGKKGKQRQSLLRKFHRMPVD